MHLDWVPCGQSRAKKYFRSHVHLAGVVADRRCYPKAVHPLCIGSHYGTLPPEINMRLVYGVVQRKVVLRVIPERDITRGRFDPLHSILVDSWHAIVRLGARGKSPPPSVPCGTSVGSVPLPQSRREAPPSVMAFKIRRIPQLYIYIIPCLFLFNKTTRNAGGILSRRITPCSGYTEQACNRVLIGDLDVTARSDASTPPRSHPYGPNSW